MLNKDIINQLLNVRKDIEKIKFEEDELRKKYNNLIKECKHEYIMIYDKTKDEYGVKNYKFCCLICGTKCLKCSDEKFISELKHESEVFCVNISDDFHKEESFLKIFEFLDNETENKIKQAQEIFSKCFNEFKDDEQQLRYQLKKEILEQVAGKEFKVKIKFIK